MAKKKNNNKSKAKKTKKNVVQAKDIKKDIEVVEEKKVEKKEIKKEEKKKEPKVKENKNSLWVRFRIFCHGVKAETKKIHWTSKSDLVKYSVATVVFVIFMALFFYAIDVIFAAVQALFK